MLNGERLIIYRSPLSILIQLLLIIENLIIAAYLKLIIKFYVSEVKS